MISFLRHNLNLVLLLALLFSMLPLAQPAFAAYSSALTSPTPPAASNTFVWTVSGVKSSTGEIASVEIAGCWKASQVVSATATKGEISVDAITGTIRVKRLLDKFLPTTITVKYNVSFGSGPTGTTITAKTNKGVVIGSPLTAGGPVCSTPPPNSPPTASAATASTAEDTTVLVTLSATDPNSSSLTFAVGAASHGSLGAIPTPTCTTGASGTSCTTTVAYSPEPNYNGADSFTFKANDGSADSNVATIAITIQPVNDAPAFTSAATNTAQTIAVGTGLAPLVAADADGDPLSYARTSGALPTGITLNANGSFAGSASATSAGNYTAGITVSDGKGGSPTTTLAITVVGDATPPPNPGSVAPPVDRSVASDLATTSAFLYSGSNPLQTGVAAGTIQVQRVAVLRGKVLVRDGQPLSGVAITVLDHPEFGQTLSRADGMFDLAVNGGGFLTLNYTKSGYLPAQRQVEAPWQDYASLPDVVLIAVDAQVTTVDLSSSTPMQVARGSQVSDEDGSRQATVLFPQGTSAEMILPDGTRQALSSIDVRATEYTVGDNGPEAMPGSLPPSSGYTYAAEFSVDQALAAKATDVRFSQPVFIYVENFLSFPVGMNVPVGYYDRAKSAWVPSENGRIIKILSVAGGLADLDTNGDGQADAAATLAALGVSDAERAQLASLYAVGQSLWRVPITHFTPWDCK
jgi:hypothetical protein